jgi:hypothetical protein
VSLHEEDVAEVQDRVAECGASLLGPGLEVHGTADGGELRR